MQGSPVHTQPITHRVGVHIRSVLRQTHPVADLLELTPQVYAPHGIQIEFVSERVLALSLAQVWPLVSAQMECRWDSVSGDQGALFRHGREGVPPHEIVAYYVAAIRTSAGLLGGCGGHKPGIPQVIISAAHDGPWTLAHEIGHVLLGSEFRPVHHPQPTNVMNVMANSLRKVPSIAQRQAAVMRRSPYCLPVSRRPITEAAVPPLPRR